MISLSVTVIVPVRNPVAVGTNATLTLQNFVGARVVGQSFVWVKSAPNRTGLERVISVVVE